MDTSDWRVLTPVIALAFISIGAGFVYWPASFMVLGAGYLGLGVYRRWF